MMSRWDPGTFSPSSSNGFIDFEQIKQIVFASELPEYAFEHKLDGSRYLLHLSQEHGNHLTSRRESVHGGAVDKIQQAYRLQGLKLPKSWRYVVLDGEVMAPSTMEGNHASLVSIIGSSPERAKQLQGQDGPLVMKVFDVLPWQTRVVSSFRDPDLREEPFQNRRTALVQEVMPALWEANSGSAVFLALMPQLRVDF